jgi:hemin uptake protein HemP
MPAEHAAQSLSPPTPAPAASPQPSAGDAQRQRVWQSAALLGEECEAIIEHRGQKYRLRCTKQGKLILYK